MSAFPQVIDHYGNTVKTASALEISVQAVCNYRDGRTVPEKLCVKIEQDTNKKFTRQMLRPDDWKEIWPELIVKKAA